MNNFLAGMAVALSFLAGLASSFTVYKVSSIEQQVEAINQSVAEHQAEQAEQTGSPPAQSSDSVSLQDPGVVANVPASNVAGNSASIQPGQFVQPALGDGAKVELLSAQRIQDPKTGKRDVVNVQFRVRRVRDPRVTSFITPVNTTARNPETGEVYDSYRTAAIKADKDRSEDRATLSVLLRSIKEGASADAYVWLKIPEGVNTVDLYIPETQVFRNVPIAG